MIVSMNRLINVFSPIDGKSDDTLGVLNINRVLCHDGGKMQLSQSEGALIIVLASELNRLDPDFWDGQTSRVFICRDDVMLSPDISSRENIHILHVSAEHELTTIINLANSLFAQINDSLVNFSKILSALSRPDHFDRLADLISNLIGCPVALIAESSALLSASGYDLSLKDWNDHLSSRLIKLPHIPDKYNYEGFNLSPLDKKLGRYEFEVFFPIHSDSPFHEIIGAIYMICIDPLTPTVYADIFQFVSYTLSWLFSRYSNQADLVSARNKRLTFFLTDLLHGIVPSEEEFSFVLNHSNFKTDRDLILICIHSSGSNNNLSVPPIQKIFSDLFRDCFSFSISADLFLLTPLDWLRTDDKSIQRKFTEALQQINCFAGLSSVFYSIDKYFIHHYARALAAAKAAQRTNDRKNWTDFNAVALNCLLNNKDINVKHLCDPALMKLIEFDNTHETDYYYTLCCYLQLNNSVTRTCDYLHIHRNTLYYRLRKIESMLSHGIDDYDCMLQLNLSINILEDIGSLKRCRIFDKQRLAEKWKEKVFSEE